MIEFSHSYDDKTLQHELEVKKDGVKVMTTSISEHKLKGKSLTKVVDCTIGMITKTLNELNQEEEDGRREQSTGSD